MHGDLSTYNQKARPMVVVRRYRPRHGESSESKTRENAHYRVTLSVTRSHSWLRGH